MKFSLSVGDLIKTKYLKDICRVAAGEKGLNKAVSWVHILEIKDAVRESVDGNELVLTTGICFTDKSIAIRFLKDLISREVAGLCIETALYYHDLDRELIDIANENDFPLIEITEISRFKDIAKGLNKMIMKGERVSYEQADNYDTRMSEIGIKASLEDGIRYTADYLNIEIAYLPSIGRRYATSDQIRYDFQMLTDSIVKNANSDEIYCKGKLAIKNLNIGSRNYGTLIFKSNNRDLMEFDLIILGRLANRIKDNIIDELRSNEENLYRQSGWISEWLEGKLSDRSISEHLEAVGARSGCKEFCVCTVKVDNPILFRDFIADMTLFVRQIFESQKLFALGYVKENMIHYIILNESKRPSISVKMRCVAERMQNTTKTLIRYDDSLFSLGKAVGRRSQLAQSYRTSMEFIDHDALKQQRILIFDELHFDRLLLHMEGMPIVDEFIEEYLGGLLLPENEELLQTLAAYYDCSCSKQKTAERLYIARQTLYFRLQKLEEMLGETFAEGEHKYALEFACKAYMHKKKYGKE